SALAEGELKKTAECGIPRARVIAMCEGGKSQPKKNCRARCFAFVVKKDEKGNSVLAKNGLEIVVPHSPHASYPTPPEIFEYDAKAESGEESLAYFSEVCGSLATEEAKLFPNPFEPFLQQHKVNCE